MKPIVSVIKIGGNIIENPKKLASFISLFSKLPGLKILVHGGGKLATQKAAQLGITSKLVQGRRITDAESLEVITMVYGGLVNKNIAAQLQAHHCNAIGLSGADGNTIRAHKRPIKEIDYGYVGDIDEVNKHVIKTLLEVKFTPVFCAITHDGNGQLLNTNADTIASEIAIALSDHYTTRLFYCFEKKGVLLDITDDDSVIPTINSKRYQELLANKSISEGMLPKLENCFYALRKQVEKVCIGNISMLSNTHALHTEITL